MTVEHSLELADATKRSARAVVQQLELAGAVGCSEHGAVLQLALADAATAQAAVTLARRREGTVEFSSVDWYLTTLRSAEHLPASRREAP